jgi:hypothetical protein
MHNGGLEKAAADRVYRAKWISHVKCGFAALQMAAKKGDLGESIQFG